MLFPDCLQKHQTSLDSEKMDFVEVTLLSGGGRRLVEWFALCSVFVLVNSGRLTYCANGLLPLALAFGRCQAGCIRLARDPLTSPTLSAPDLINCT